VALSREGNTGSAADAIGGVASVTGAMASHNSFNEGFAGTSEVSLGWSFSSTGVA